MKTFRRLTTVFIALAVVLSSVALTAPQVSAADPAESITMSPVSKKYTVDPGQTISDTLTILNDGQDAYDFTVYATPYSVVDSQYTQNFTHNKPNADVYTWIEFQQSTYHIESRQTIEIPYTMHVRANASPGGHYGAIFAEVQPPSGAEQLARKKRVGCMIYTTVSGDVRLSGNVTSLKAPWFQQTTPMLASTEVKNTGNTDFAATVAYQVSDIFGQVKYSVKNDYTILPNTTRQIDMQWNNSAWFGMYKVHISATVLGKTTTKDTYVLMMPIWLLLLLAIAVLFGGVYALIGKKSHRSSAKE